MCVIALADSVKLPLGMIEDMFEANDKGAGIAWRDKEKGKHVVRFEKGLDLAEIKYLASSAPLPYCAHFRIPTCGPRADIYAPLCHPFPITAGVELNNRGLISSAEGVLFHNGHYGKWEETLKDLAIRGMRKIPTGKWSDSRVLAFAAFHMGLGILDIIDEKVIVFPPEPEEIMIFGTPWHTEEKGAILVSNLGWRGSSRRAASFNRVQTVGPAAEKEEHTRANILPLAQGSSQVISDVRPPGGNTNHPSPGPSSGTSTTPCGSTSRGPIIDAGSASLNRLPLDMSQQGWAAARAEQDRRRLAAQAVAPSLDPFAQVLKELDQHRLVSPVTAGIMREAIERHAQKDPFNNRLLSKKRLNKLKAAHERWVRAEEKARINQAERELAVSPPPTLH